MAKVAAWPCPSLGDGVLLGFPSADLGCRTYGGPESVASLGNQEVGCSSDTSVEMFHFCVEQEITLDQQLFHCVEQEDEGGNEVADLPTILFTRCLKALGRRVSSDQKIIQAHM